MVGTGKERVTFGDTDVDREILCRRVLTTDSFSQPLGPLDRKSISRMTHLSKEHFPFPFLHDRVPVVPAADALLRVCVGLGSHETVDFGG